MEELREVATQPRERYAHCAKCGFTLMGNEQFGPVCNTCLDSQSSTTTTPSTSPTLDHDTLLFVLEELHEQIKDTRRRQHRAMQESDMKLAGLLHAECNAYGKFGDRLVAAYKERKCD